MANPWSITVFFHSTHGDDGGIGRIVEAGCFRCERIECRHSVHQKQVTMMSAYLIHVTRRVIVCLVSGCARKAKVELPSLGEYERQAKVPRIGL